MKNLAPPSNLIMTMLVLSPGHGGLIDSRIFRLLFYSLDHYKRYGLVPATSSVHKAKSTSTNRIRPRQSASWKCCTPANHKTWRKTESTFSRSRRRSCLSFKLARPGSCGVPNTSISIPSPFSARHRRCRKTTPSSHTSGPLTLAKSLSTHYSSSNSFGYKSRFSYRWTRSTWSKNFSFYWSSLSNSKLCQSKSKPASPSLCEYRKSTGWPSSPSEKTNSL